MDVSSQLKAHYEKCFAEHGCTPQGLNWPNAEDMQTRYRVMAELMGDAPGSLLDIGCGYGGFLEYLHEQKINVDYTGVDISPQMIEAAKARHDDAAFEVVDILNTAPPRADYAVMNGVLTVKSQASYDAMEAFAQAMIKAAFDAVDKGLAFNVMSHHVDWQRDDLFHWPFDAMAAFVTEHCSRHVTIRADYGLYEYTAYLYKDPQ